MTQHPIFLCAAGNVEVPACLVLTQKGYAVSSPDRSAADAARYAEKDGLRFQADSLVELLGLVTMFEHRGAEWAASDEEIDDFLATYDR